MRECAHFGCSQPVLPSPGRRRPPTRCKAHRRAWPPPPEPPVYSGGAPMDIDNCPLAKWLEAQPRRYRFPCNNWKGHPGIAARWWKMIDEADGLSRM